MLKLKIMIDITYYKILKKYLRGKDNVATMEFLHVENDCVLTKSDAHIILHVQKDFLVVRYLNMKNNHCGNIFHYIEIFYDNQKQT